VRRDAAINRTEAALAALANALILQLRLTCSRLRLTCSRLRGDLVAKDDLNDRPWHAPSVAAQLESGAQRMGRDRRLHSAPDGEGTGSKKFGCRDQSARRALRPFGREAELRTVWLPN